MPAQSCDTMIVACPILPIDDVPFFYQMIHTGKQVFMRADALKALKTPFLDDDCIIDDDQPPHCDSGSSPQLHRPQTTELRAVTLAPTPSDLDQDWLLVESVSSPLNE
jgi:hypothetical protein